MPTLYVENVPEDIYQALRKRAKTKGSSMAAEVLAILRQSVPTEAELRRRKEFYERMAEFRAKHPLPPGSLASGEEMIREARER
jgi:plasmid stability protein